MSATLQADDQGTLHVPASLLPNAAPSATYSIEEQGGRTVIVNKSEVNDSDFQTPEAAQRRIAALRSWLDKARTPAGLSDHAVSRESMYD